MSKLFDVPTVLLFVGFILEAVTVIVGTYYVDFCGIIENVFKLWFFDLEMLSYMPNIRLPWALLTDELSETPHLNEMKNVHNIPSN